MFQNIDRRKHKNTRTETKVTVLWTRRTYGTNWSNQQILAFHESRSKSEIEMKWISAIKEDLEPTGTTQPSWTLHIRKHLENTILIGKRPNGKMQEDWKSLI